MFLGYLSFAAVHTLLRFLKIPNFDHKKKSENSKIHHWCLAPMSRDRFFCENRGGGLVTLPTAHFLSLLPPNGMPFRVPRRPAARHFASLPLQQPETGECKWE